MGWLDERAFSAFLAAASAFASLSVTFDAAQIESRA
jgi:hypothetical protein